MDLSPTQKQVVLLLGHNLHGVPHITTLHTLDSHNLRSAIVTQQIDLGMSVTKYMDMSR